MAMQKLVEYLKKNNAKFEIISHVRGVTAESVAHQAKIPMREMVKTLMVKADDELLMVVVPSSLRLDLDRLRMITGVKTAELAKENEFGDFFPECELGAMPPFGNLYGFREFVDQKLREDEIISFNAGNHEEIIRMTYSDFERLANPIVAAVT